MVAAAVGTLGMIGGQAADLEAERRWPENAAEVLESIHRRKTGALLEASLRLGGLYAGASEANLASQHFSGEARSLYRLDAHACKARASGLANEERHHRTDRDAADHKRDEQLYEREATYPR